MTGSYFVSNHSKIYYFDVNCTGEEFNLNECPKENNCTNEPLNSWYNDERAAVACEIPHEAGNTYAHVHVYLYK